MAGFRERLGDGLRQVDASLVAAVHAGISVDADKVRSWLRGAQRPFVDPDHKALPSSHELERTAHWVIEQSRFKLALLGGVAGVAGAVSVPPEALASTLASLRLAQRLSIVYGFDPNSDRGERAVWSAMAAGFGLELPGDGPVGLKASELPLVLVRGARARYPNGAIAAAVLRESAWRIGRRMSRWMALPGLSSALSAAGAHQRASEIGTRMLASLQRLADAPAIDPSRLEDAVELG
jgi:hypothetical protein